MSPARCAHCNAPRPRGTDRDGDRVCGPGEGCSVRRGARPTPVVRVVPYRVTIGDESLTLAQWCVRVPGLPPALAHARIHALGWDPVRAVTTPPGSRGGARKGPRYQPVGRAS